MFPIFPVYQHLVALACRAAALHSIHVSFLTGSSESMVLASPCVLILRHDSQVLCLCRFCVLAVIRGITYKVAK
jgi:hypothetical protein